MASYKMRLKREDEDREKSEINFWIIEIKAGFVINNELKKINAIKMNDLLKGSHLSLVFQKVEQA